jgi:hypothetical protein
LLDIRPVMMQIRPLLPVAERSRLDKGNACVPAPVAAADGTARAFHFAHRHTEPWLLDSLAAMQRRWIATEQR